MPFYEYECSSCKFYTEVMQKITEAPLTKCPSCGKKALKKLVSAPNFRLKGGGWYETDFKGDKENRRNLAGADADDSSKSESKSEPAKKEDSKSEGAKVEASGAEAKAAAAGAGSAGESKAGSTRRNSSGGKAPKPASRTAAGKARPVTSRSKPKSVARKKKARR